MAPSAIPVIPAYFIPSSIVVLAKSKPSLNILKLESPKYTCDCPSPLTKNDCPSMVDIVLFAKSTLTFVITPSPGVCKLTFSPSP